jgi:homoserine kinase type II
MLLSLAATLLKMSLSILTPFELEALSHWNIGSILNAELAKTGSVNRTILLETSKGSCALRACRKTKTARDVQQECDVIRFVTTLGLPALAPLHLPDDLPFLTLQNRHFLLFPKAVGSQTPRVLLEPWQLQALGKCLADLTLALENYPTRDIHQRTFQFNLETTLARLDELERYVQSFPNPGLDEAAAITQIKGRRRFLETHKPIASLRGLHVQVTHGDFQDTNVFFANNQLSSIIDWDQIRVVPRYFELLRTTTFLLSELTTSTVRNFVRAFIENYPVDNNELNATVQLYSADHVYNLWLLETIYLEGNDKARVFLRGKFADSFTPFEEVWERLEVNL